MIKASNIHKHYGPLEVLKGVDIHIQKGEVVAIIGPSGAGKTTLLQLLGTLDSPSKKKKATLEINGQNLQKISEKTLSKFRNKNIGFIFQFHQLLPEFTALENVCIPAFIAKTSKKEAESKALELLNYLGLKERIHHKPSELSGGEQQRVAVARDLVNKPAVIFADEPSGNLDSKSAESLHHLFLKLREELGQTFVIVTHNKKLAKMADRTLEMRDGKIVADSSFKL
jgi:lipoprotein-releasing system ATP-binding protein